MATTGSSILEQLWELLDVIVDRIKAGTPNPDGRDPGRAEGLASAIALLKDPYNPDLNLVRQESVERWQARQKKTAPKGATRGRPARRRQSAKSGA